MSQFFASGDQRIEYSNEYSGLIFLRIDWLDLFAVQFSSVQLLSRV